jgi:hypothetical protein
MTCRRTGNPSAPDPKSFAVHPWQNRIHRSGKRKSASEYSAKIIKTLNYKAFAEGFARAFTSCGDRWAGKSVVFIQQYG